MQQCCCFQKATTQLSLASYKFTASFKYTQVNCSNHNISEPSYHKATPSMCQWRQVSTSEHTSTELQSVSIYGVRIYTEGAILLSHVHRLALVFSCT